MVEGKYRNAFFVCSATSRLLVHSENAAFHELFFFICLTAKAQKAVRPHRFCMDH